MFFRFRLAGLAVAAGFCTAAYFINGFSFTPLTATRKIILLAPAAALIGILCDAFARPARATAVALGLASGALSIWVFWSVLVQKDLLQALALGAGAALWVALVVSLTCGLAAQPVRAGAAGLGLGLGTGAAAVLGATASYGLLGIALGAAAGAFLLAQMILNRKTDAGFTFTLPAGLLAALVGVGSVLLAQLPWHALALLLLAPLAAHVPVPERVSVPVQAVILSALTLAAGAVPAVFMWRAEPGLPF
ncbi:MAG: hypothetical protein FJY54_10270 [Betaproteobacteria bacterium]|nr:hypothetical protein [Betaproteobacteria bacterium]